MEGIQKSIGRTLCFFESIGYLPTLGELFLSLKSVEKYSFEDIELTTSTMIGSKLLREQGGRIGWTESFSALYQALEERDLFQARKRRRARWVAYWLVRLGGVRFIALANTAAWGYSRDFGDLDFLIVVRHGSIWQSRLWAVFPFKFLRWLPREPEHRDAVCLSYFVSDRGLDLSKHCLDGGDPYFEQWFLGLLPLYDDGVGEELWKKNGEIRQSYPHAVQWMVPPDLQIACPVFRIPLLSVAEKVARKIQERWFPKKIREMLNRDSRVMVSEEVLKFHTDDGREEYRRRFEELCKQRGVV